MKIKQVHVISSSEGGEKERMGEGEERGNHGYKARMEVRCTQGSGIRAGRTDGRMRVQTRRQITCSQKSVSYRGWVCRQVLLRGELAPPFTAKPSDERQQSHSFRGKKTERGEVSEVKTSVCCELWSVFLPSPVSPQPPLSVLLQPVVFQSIGSQPSSLGACALPGPVTISAPPPHAFFPHHPLFLSLSQPLPALPACQH